MPGHFLRWLFCYPLLQNSNILNLVYNIINRLRLFAEKPLNSVVFSGFLLQFCGQVGYLLICGLKLCVQSSVFSTQLVFFVCPRFFCLMLFLLFAFFVKTCHHSFVLLCNKLRFQIIPFLYKQSIFGNILFKLFIKFRI